MTTKHIALRLGTAFAVLIAILLALGQLGLRRMQTIDETLSDIAGSKSIDLELARRALMISNDNNRIVMEIVLVENRRLVEPLLAARSQNSKEITTLIEKSESRCDSEKEKQVLSEVKRTREPYLESCQRAIHLLVDERKHDEAETVMVNETLPALLKYQAAWEKFVEFQKEELDVAVKQAQVDYPKARRLALLLIGLAVVLAIVIALFATREASHEIAARIDAEKELSKLNASLEERVIQRTSELSETIKHINLQAAALGAVANAIAVTDFRGTIQWVNHAFTTMTGYSAEEVVGKNHRLLKSGKQSQSFYADLWSTVSSGKVWHGELINRRKDGRTYIEEQTITPLAQNVGEAIWTHFVAIKQDITERKRAEEILRNNENKYRALFEDSADANWLLDEKGFSACNSAALQMFGYTNVAEMKHPVDISPPNQPDGRSSQAAAEEKIAAAFLHGKERFEWLHQRKDGNVFPAEVCLTALTLSGQPTLLATVRDISDRKLAEERVQFLAYYDALTRLPNRTLLQDRLAKALAAARRQEHKIGLLFLDLDRFKDINDSLGHSVGDLLLQGVGERLETWGREQDTVARLGGDEFLVMLTDVKDVPDVAVAAERLMDAMTAEFVIQGHSFNVSCSIGISIFPEHGADCETLIKNADAAMYSAKADGRNNFRFFTDDMNAQAVERLSLESSLRSALAKEELFLMYQPQMDIATGRITGLEALLRWQHPELGLVPPDKFIRIAENSGLIIPIGEWVLRTACAQAWKWQDEGFPALTVAVNVSALQFRQESFGEVIRKVLHETGLPPQYLELELTESLLLTNADLMLSVIQKLKATGVTLAIDDFGTGYSSFSYLRQFQVSKLKIDRSFITNVAANPDDAAITAAIISMAKSLRLKVIAEGVENESQMSFLRAHHCDVIQGYYFSRPLAFDKVADKLRDNVAETQAEHKPTGDNCDNKPYEVSISLMSIGLALLVSADPVTIQQFSLALRELSISPDACQDAASAGLLLKSRKFDAVIVDLQLGEQSGMILDEVHLSASNRTAVTFGIGDNDAKATSAFRKKSQFVFERPLSAQSIHKTLKPAYGLMLRERRRYFRYPVSIPVIIRSESMQEVWCNSVNISGGGMALSTQVPLLPGESVRVQFTLPDHTVPFFSESTICWSKTGHLGVHFVSVSDDHKSQLQAWLSQKLEETLPEFVAEQFRKEERAPINTLSQKPDDNSGA